MLRVLIADDAEVYREGLKAILSGAKGIEVVAEAGVPNQVLLEVQAHLPDVLILDLLWFGDDTAGAAIITDVKKQCPEVMIVAITAYDHLIEGARKAGADIAVTKMFSKVDLIKTLSGLAERRRGLSRPVVETGVAEVLTERESEVLRLLAEGFSDREVARQLEISLNTARGHVKSIRGKLGVANRTEAVIVAQRRGLLGV